MAHRGRSPVDRGSIAGRVAVAVVLLMLVSAGVAYRFDLGERLGIAGAPTPAEVAAPPGLELPSPAAAGAVARRLPDGPVRAGAVRRALARLLSAKRLGPQVGVVVADGHGSPVFASGPPRVTPASTMKLLTTTAALDTLGPEHRFTTRVVGGRGRITLVGGGDPLLASAPADSSSYPHVADVETLARLSAKALRRNGHTRVRLRYDDSLFTGPAASPTWEPDYLPDDVVSPITALWVDEGREQPGEAQRSARPAFAAAGAFAAALGHYGIQVVGRAQPGVAPANAPALAEVRSAQLVEIVQHVLELSDNEGAEVLSRQVALAHGDPATFVGAARAVRAVVKSLGVDLRGAVLNDGSGLSREDRLPVQALVDVLAVAARHARLAGLVEGLPVAGSTGSLGYRFVATGTSAGLGAVRAKTGTLTGVHGLAGVVTSRDGSVMTFAMVADRVRVRNTLFVRDQLDRLTSALAACSCTPS